MTFQFLHRPTQPRQSHQAVKYGPVFERAKKDRCLVWSLKMYGGIDAHWKLSKNCNRSASSYALLWLPIVQYRSNKEHLHGGGTGRQQTTDKQNGVVQQRPEVIQQSIYTMS